MNKKILQACSIALLVMLLISASALACTVCRACNKSGVTHYNLNNDSYHRYLCNKCGATGTEGHNIVNYATRECTECGDVIGD